MKPLYLFIYMYKDKLYKYKEGVGLSSLKKRGLCLI